MTTSKPTAPSGLAGAILDMPGSIAKDRDNKFAKYDYTSADMMYVNLRSHLARHGLAVWQDEVESDIVDRGSQNNGKRDLWVKARYEMALTPNGHRPTAEQGVERVTVMAPASSAQSFAAIRTYALKYWLRGKCLIATGEFDEDVDSAPEAPPPAETVPDKPIDGRWNYDENTGMLIATGFFGGPDNKLRAFFRELVLRMSPDTAPETALFVYESNDTMIKKLPESGQEQINQKADFHRKKLDELNAPQEA